jgi:hypothetical protein
MKYFKFASFAALSLSSTEALRLSKSFEEAEAKLMQLEKTGPPKLDNVMQSVSSLQRAVHFHQKEEKLLGEIGTDLKAFWHEADQSKQFVSMEEKTEGKGKQKAQGKVVAKTEVKGKTEETQKATAPPDIPQMPDFGFLEQGQPSFVQLSSAADAENDSQLDEQMDLDMTESADRPPQAYQVTAVEV